jgi:hypothetical protein
LHRQVRLVKRPQARKLALAQLKPPLRRRQILQPVSAQVAHPHVDEVACRPPKQHLATVAGSGDPRRAVHVQADITLGRHARLAGLQPHPHGNAPTLQRSLTLRRRSNSVRRAVEPDEERVALRLHLDTAVAGERRTKQTTVLRKRSGVTGAELLQQARRTLDVRNRNVTVPDGSTDWPDRHTPCSRWDRESPTILRFVLPMVCERGHGPTVPARNDAPNDPS